MPRPISAFSLVLALAVAGSPLNGQSARRDEEAPVAADNEIVVTGRSPVTSREFRAKAEAFVRQLGEEGPINQVGRWGQPLCPRAEGLSRAFKAFVEETVRRIAREAGAPDGGDCAGMPANALIVFTTRPQAFMDDVRRHHLGLLGYHFFGQRKAIASFAPPMKSWHVSMTEIPGAYQAIDHAYGPSPPAGTGSRIRPQYKSRFAFALVVVDSNAIEDQAVGPVAARIAMLALTDTREREGCSPIPSVLDFLDPACGEGPGSEGLTAYDEAYLKALYAFKGDELKGFMRDTIAGRIVEDLGALAVSPPGE